MGGKVYKYGEKAQIPAFSDRLRAQKLPVFRSFVRFAKSKVYVYGGSGFASGVPSLRKTCIFLKTHRMVY